VLGLRPSSPREEGAIVSGWLQRAQSRQQTVGSFWYIVNMDWWTNWTNYVVGQVSLGAGKFGWYYRL